MIISGLGSPSSDQRPSRKRASETQKNFWCPLKSVEFWELPGKYVCRKRCCPIALPNFLLTWISENCDWELSCIGNSLIFVWLSSQMRNYNQKALVTASCPSEKVERTEKNVVWSSTDRALEKGVWIFFKSRKLAFLSTSNTSSQQETVNFCCILASLADTNDTRDEGILELRPLTVHTNNSGSEFKLLIKNDLNIVFQATNVKNQSPLICCFGSCYR